MKSERTKLFILTTLLLMGSTLIAAEVYTDVDVMALPIGPVEVQEAEPIDWFEYGADFRYRIRHEENRWGWEDRRADRTWARYRTRLWTTLTPMDDLSFNFRLVHEPRHFYRPEDREGDVIWKEAIFDHFNVKWKNAFEIPLTVIAGRQDIRFGKGWMITEGTLIDGDRARYFDALRTIWKVEGIKTTINAIGVYNHAYSSDILPPFNDEEVKLSRSEERGAILYASNKSIEKTKLDSYFIYMHDEYVEDGKGIQGEIYTFGGLVDAKLGENWACYAEVAPQFGRRNGHRMSAFGANSLLSYLLHDKRNSRFNLAYEYASGDDYTTKSFSRFWAWGKPWYGQLTNLHKVGVGYVGELCKGIRLITNYRAFWPDMIPEDRTGVSGEDAMKGQQVDMFIIQKFNKHIRHRINAGLFFPGDYYEEDKQETHTFARYEITLTL